MLLSVSGLLTSPLPSYAADTTYQLEGEWASDTPSTVKTRDAVSAHWWFNLNDTAPAPGNAPVDNVTLTVTAQNAVFETIPSQCLTTGVTPSSAISADGTTLTCNVGTKNQGTAVSMDTAMRVSGATGDEVAATATIADQEVTLPVLTLENPFLQDIRWQENASTFTLNADSRDVNFNWTIFHGLGSPAGPDTVNYELTVSNSVAAAMEAGPLGCSPFTQRGAVGHPWSGGTHPANQVAPFVGSCTLTQTSPTTFVLTISGIDYGQVNPPTKDSAGNNLPTDRVAVASGQIQVRVLSTAGSGRVTMQSDAPTYTAPSGETSNDDPSNNNSAITWTTGGTNSGWLPTGSGSTVGQWIDQFKAAAGSNVVSTESYDYQKVQTILSTQAGLCTILDTRYSTYVSHTLRDANYSFANIDAPAEYYVGSSVLVDPDDPAYDPNAFRCIDDPAGWTTTPPADLSSVKAVRAVFDLSVINRDSRPYLNVTQTLSATAAAGQDVWTWGSYISPALATNVWANPSRATTGAAPVEGVDTPGARYPFAGNGRDILRITSVAPSIEKSVSPTVVDPGGVATYTLNYSADGVGAIAPTVDGYQIVDTLPNKIQYVPGSSSPEPVVTVNGSGAQVLTWTLNGVPTNAGNTLTYDGVVADDAASGTRLVNTVSSSIGGVQSAPAQASVTVNATGLTSIVKTADQAYIPNINGDGVGEGSWTVLVSSADPAPQQFVDVIDILPYNGDGRGTVLAGTFTLSEPVEVSMGATVYYTTADPATLTDDPSNPSNGTAGDPTGNSVGWSTTFTPDATAVRVITDELAPRGSFTFTPTIVTAGMAPGDNLVNRAQGRAENTRLVMRTSAPTQMANEYSASLKKYVQDTSGKWHDANDPVDYPKFVVGDTVRYRIVVENTGTGTLTNVVVSDDLQPQLGSFVIDSLPSGESETHEFEIVLSEPLPGTIVNTACATADVPVDADVAPTINCDPAGVLVTGDPTHTKSLVSAEPVGKGAWKVIYRVDVSNRSDLPTTYDLDDELRFASEVKVTSAKVTSAPSGVTLSSPAWNGSTQKRIASEVSLPGKSDPDYAVHSYEVTVMADAPLSLKGAGTDPDPTVCGTNGDNGRRAFTNTSTLTKPSGGQENGWACAPVPSITITKTLIGSPVQGDDGQWTVNYEIAVANRGGSDGTYTLTDRLRFGKSITVKSSSVTSAPEGVVLVEGWSGRGAEGAAENVVAKDVPLPSKATHVYRVQVSASIDTSSSSEETYVCPAPGSDEPGAFSNTAAVVHNGLDTHSQACDSSSPKGPLAYTGSSKSLLIASGLGVLLMAAGALVVFERRRRGASA